ncbi:MAG: hypothetical protein R6U41_06515 [Desulfosalsimonas sp.]|uniref:hypothetical protein n=1 Tax=Desulfosalsimonas sp. TaxID=3073848 RepID=UPI003970D0F5
MQKADLGPHATILQQPFSGFVCCLRMSLFSVIVNWKFRQATLPLSICRFHDADVAALSENHDFCVVRQWSERFWISVFYRDSNASGRLLPDFPFSLSIRF